MRAPPVGVLRWGPGRRRRCERAPPSGLRCRAIIAAMEIVTVSQIVAGVLGIVLIGWVLWDVFQTVVVPRPSPGRYRIARNLTRTSWRILRKWAARAPTPARREGMLGTFAPALVLGLLVAWIASLLLGYGLLIWALRDEMRPVPEDLGTAIYAAGASLLTVGFGDFVATAGPARLVLLLAAGTGLGVVALTITYLFSLYGAFARRELLVVTLDARAGAPPSGVSLLETHARLDMLDELPGLFHEWEVWAAQVLDTHLAYPILAFFRSSHDNESWISSLGAVLDAAVLVQTAIDDVPRAPAEMMFKMGEHLVEDLGNFLHFEFTSDPGVERFEFDQARDRLAAAGFHLTESAAAWHGFTTRRGHYASRLNWFALFWMSPPAQWIGDRSALRHHDAADDDEAEEAMALH
jgi:hypothetical protein